MIDDLWYKNGVFYCLSVGTYMDANGDGIGDFNPSPNEQELTGTSKNLGVRAGVTYALRGACTAEAEKFDWAMALAPAAATIARGANGSFSPSAMDMKQRPIMMGKVMNKTCTSSDASVATVDNMGNVKAVKAGTPPSPARVW